MATATLAGRVRAPWGVALKHRDAKFSAATVSLLSFADGETVTMTIALGDGGARESRNSIVSCVATMEGMERKLVRNQNLDAFDSR